MGVCFSLTFEFISALFGVFHPVCQFGHLGHNIVELGRFPLTLHNDWKHNQASQHRPCRGVNQKISNGDWEILREYVSTLCWPTTIAPHQGSPRSTCMNSSRFWIRPTGVLPAKPSSARLCSGAATWRTSAAVGAVSTTCSMSGCVKIGMGSAGTTSAAESKTGTGGGGGGTSTTDAAAETGSNGTWRYERKQVQIIQVRRIYRHKWVRAGRFSYLFSGWLTGEGGGDRGLGHWLTQSFKHGNCSS